MYSICIENEIFTLPCKININVFASLFDDGIIYPPKENDKSYNYYINKIFDYLQMHYDFYLEGKESILKNNMFYTRCMNTYFMENNMIKESNNVLTQMVKEILYYAKKENFDIIKLSLRGR